MRRTIIVLKLCKVERGEHQREPYLALLFAPMAATSENNEHRAQRSAIICTYLRSLIYDGFEGNRQSPITQRCMRPTSITTTGYTDHMECLELHAQNVRNNQYTNWAQNKHLHSVRRMQHIINQNKMIPEVLVDTGTPQVSSVSEGKGLNYTSYRVNHNRRGVCGRRRSSRLPPKPCSTLGFLNCISRFSQLLASPLVNFTPPM